MNATTYPPKSFDRARENFAALLKLSERYNGSPDLKAQIDSGNVSEALQELGIEVPAGVQAKIVANTPDTFHVVLPINPNAGLSEETLATVAGGGKTAVSSRRPMNETNSGDWNGTASGTYGTSGTGIG